VRSGDNDQKVGSRAAVIATVFGEEVLATCL
jgi:hypothetical protein